MSGKHMGLHMLAFALLIVGGLNWGLALWQMDIATWGLGMTLVKVIYGLIGLSAIYEGLTHVRRCKECSGQR